MKIPAILCFACVLIGAMIWEINPRMGLQAWTIGAGFGVVLLIVAGWRKFLAHS